MGMLVRIVKALCITGLLIAVILVLASRSSYVYQKIEERITASFRDDLQCSWQGHISSVNLFTLTAQCTDMVLKPLTSDEQWSVVIDHAQVQGSWRSLMLDQELRLEAFFTDVVVQEYSDDSSFGLYHFLQRLFAVGADSFIQVPYVQISRGVAVLQNTDASVVHTYSFNSQIAEEEAQTHLQVFVTQGKSVYQQQVVVEQANGVVQVRFPYTKDRTKISAQVDMKMQIPLLGSHKDSFVTGTMQEGAGSFVISNQDKTFTLDPVAVTIQPDAIPVKFTMNIALDLLRAILFPNADLAKIDGKITTTFQGDLQDSFSVWKSKLHLEKILYKGIDIISQGELSFSRKDDEYTASIKVGSHEYIGTIKASLEGLFFYLQVKTAIELFGSYWTIQPEKTFLKGSIEKDGSAKGSFAINLSSILLDETKELQGTFEVQEKRLTIQAVMDNKTLHMVLDFSHSVPSIIDIVCTVKDELKGTQELLVCKAQDDTGSFIAGYIDFKLIQELVPVHIKPSFMQQGKIEFSAQLHEGVYYVFTHSQEAHIRIPGVYNVVDSMQAKVLFDLVNKKIVIQNLMADLYEGDIESVQQVCRVSQVGGVFLHVPLLLKKVLISWYKGIYGIFSGKLLLYHEQQALKLRGDLYLDAAQLKGNIFSTEFQKKLFHQTVGQELVLPVCDLDVHVSNSAPIMIDTSFLQAQAYVLLHVQGTSTKPMCTGEVTIESGQLHFPYKALPITQGKITFVPHQQDPIFEFTAKGRIKRHLITLRATGSIHEQHIALESSPYLNEEQIVSLLLIGSEDSSLSTVMPAVLMQQLNTLIFGPAIAESKLQKLFQRLLKPLQKVRFYPQFINQSGRGGVRAIVEVDATDRLHGKMDSNLMHFEDTKFEIDYTLTDDIMLRVMKDGPGMYGGEVEMKWRFS